MWNRNLELFLLEERQRNLEAELLKQKLRREAKEAGLPAPGMVRRGIHYMGVALERAGHRLQLECRDALSVSTPATQRQ